MHPILEHVEERLGPRPRRFDRDEWPELLISTPTWMPGDDMEVIFDDQRFLYEEGEVVWGTHVQANALLYHPCPYNCPSTFIYSRHEAIDREPQLLREIASQLYGLKEGQNTDPDETRYGAMLAHEQMRAMRWKVPDRFAQGLPIYSTTVMVCRRHMPRGVLIRRAMPLLRHRDTVATLIVPHWFWPRSFRESWEDEVEESFGRRPWVTAGNEFADQIERVARREGYHGVWFLRVYVEIRKGGLERAIRLDFDKRWDSERDRMFHANGIEVVMTRRDAEELRGLHLDFTDVERDGCYRLI